MGYTKDVGANSSNSGPSSGEGASRARGAFPSGGPSGAPTASVSVRYGGAILVVAACTAAAALMHGHFELSNLTMVYLLGVVVAAVGFGRGPAIAAAVLGVAAFDFGFVPPRFTFRVAHTQYLVTFAVMLAVAVVTGTLTARLREQLGEARRRERRAAALYRLSHELVSRSLAADLLAVAAERIGEVLGVRVAVVRPEASGRAAVMAGDPGLVQAPDEHAAARRAFENGQMAGLERATTGPTLLHVPLQAGLHSHGVVCVQQPSGGWSPERLQLLRMLTSQTALALERCRLAEEATTARAQAETERARSALLSSVSHDLRTPLAAITGAATSLRDGAGLGDSTRSELARTIAEEAQRLNRLIGNILDMTRLESGSLRVRKEWHSLEEVVGAALVRLEDVLGARPVHVLLPCDLSLVSMDDVLFEQVVWNLVENAHKYSPAGLPIDVCGVIDGSCLRLEVTDRGPGLLPGEEVRVFDKFYRSPDAAGFPGAGLGLAICHGIVLAHGGTITAANRPGGGAIFTVRVPLTGEPPAVEREDSPVAAAASNP